MLSKKFYTSIFKILVNMVKIILCQSYQTFCTYINLIKFSKYGVIIRYIIDTAFSEKSNHFSADCVMTKTFV